jgi:stage V sporulation protein R
LWHNHEGVDLRHDYMRDTLKNLQLIWTRPVALLTRIDKTQKLVRHTGENLEEKELAADSELIKGLGVG